MTQKFDPTPEQQAAIDAREANILVAAAAGSGKTRVLVERLMDQVDAGADVSRFLIITYTRAAAEELRGRILEEIRDREAIRPSRHFERQRALLYSADIGTIHGFCSKLIREFSHVLGTNPDFRTADETEARLLLRTALEDTLELRYRDPEAYPGFAELADTVSEGRRDQALIDTVLDVHQKLQSHAYPEQWAREQLDALDLHGKRDARETSWGRFLLDATQQEAVYWLDEMHRLRDSLRDSEVYENAYGANFEETIAHLSRLVGASKQGWDETSACFPVTFTRLKTVKGGAPPRVKSLRDGCKDAMKKLASVFDLPSYELFADMKAVRPVIGALVELVLDVDRAYAQEKTRRSCLDFSDLEHLAVRLLVDEETGAPTEAAGELAARYTEVMVDEFQDVSAVQDLLFRALGEYGARVFMVGDVKQSIYRFRLADPRIFLGYYHRFPTVSDDGLRRKVLLSKNFRSRPGILDAVNFLFRRIMSETLGEMAYGDEEALYPGREDVDCTQSGVALDVLNLKGLPKDGTDDRVMAEARHIGAQIRALHEDEGYAWGDFAILLRSVSGKAGRYEKALGELNIPVQKSGGADFFYTEEVATIFSLLQVIENPRQDVPLVGLLRSPLFCFTPDELAAIRLVQKDGSFYEALVTYADVGNGSKPFRADSKCTQFLADLTRYREEAPDMPVDQFLWYLMDRTNALSIFGARVNGAQRRENLLALLAYAKRAVSGGCLSLFDFVQLLEKRLEQGDAPKPASSGDANAVTIMSVHKSKGLEFPVVFLPDLAKRFNQQDTIKQILVHPNLGLGTIRRDLERKIRYSTLPRTAIARQIRQETLAEELRVLYVAMTRARERLVMTVTLDDADKTLSELAHLTGDPVSPYVLEASGNMARWVLLPAMLRPEAVTLRGEAEDVPLAACDYPWIVRRIDCVPVGADLVSALWMQGRHKVCPYVETNIQPDADFVRAMEYVYPYDAAVNLPSKLTATELKGRALDREASEEAVAYGTKKPPAIFRQPDFTLEHRPPTPAERGTATHLVMQYIDFARTDTLAQVEAEIARLAGEGHIPERLAPAIDAGSIFAFFQSPLGQRVCAAPVLRREFKFSLLMPAGDLLEVEEADEQVLLQGVIDCYLEDPDGLVLIDFKTDYVPPGGLAAKAAEYAGQMTAYAYALERITGKRVKETLLYFFGAGEAVGV